MIEKGSERKIERGSERDKKKKIEVNQKITRLTSTERQKIDENR